MTIKKITPPAEHTSSTYLEEVKKGIRLKKGFDEEIDSYIKACRLDLQNAGIPIGVTEDEEDDLVKTAIIMYVKAMFGVDNKNQDRDLAIYENIKISLKNSNYKKEENNDG